MPSRDVTIQWTGNDEAGDETYELWLKHADDAWELDQTGDVALDIDSHQSFLVSTLIEGDTYTVQIRQQRAGRYRAGYLTADPDTWPSQSRVTFVPGALVGVGAPVINSATWERTSSSTTDIALSINADDLTKDLKVFRDGVLITTLTAGPFTNPIAYTDHDPPLGVSHEYTARHTASSLDGPLSAPLDCFAGPLPPTSVSQTSLTSHFGSYTIDWDDDGVDTDVEDDFLCADTFVNQTTTDTPPYERFVEMDIIPDHGTVAADFHARVRARVTAFTITDVSDWATIAIECQIYDDNTAFNSCP